MKSWITSTLKDTFLTYSTTKVVQVPNTKIAVIYRILQVAIFAYIACYIVWYKKGYQEFQEPRGTSVIKVKGIGRVTERRSDGSSNSTKNLLWDTGDYQLPPLENNAFFIATRQIVTYNQTRDVCASALDDKLFCNSTNVETRCPAGQSTPNTFGYFTGRCVESPENRTVNVCEVRAWCPEELSQSTEYVVNASDVAEYTVYLKTLVTFIAFDINLRNVRDATDFTCRYDPKKDPACPILRIGDILSGLDTNKEALFKNGGLVEIRQLWDCNFDYNHEKCFPEYSFNILQSGDDRNSPGINYRTAVNTRVDDKDYRTLSKIYGLRFVITISGTSGRFNIVNLVVAIGSGIGFMVISDIVCDSIFMYIHRQRKRYRDGKFAVCDIANDELFEVRKEANDTF